MSNRPKRKAARRKAQRAASHVGPPPSMDQILEAPPTSRAQPIETPGKP